VPENIWFSRISIDTKPSVEKATVARKTTEAEPAPEEMNRGFSFDPAPTAQKKENIVPPKKWLNMEGYVFIADGRDVKLQEANSAAGKFSSFLQTSKLFIETDPNLIQDDSIYEYNITEFRYSIELEKAINSRAFTDLLRSRMNGNNAKNEKKD
jgi:hypothetical protein